jgi:exonuclease SbcC
MKLNFISLKNYRRFKSVELEVADGMVSIMGPNGAGKSSLMEAVAWALYGNQTEIVRTGKESIKREGSARTDPCSVKVEFDFEDTGYVVERSMKGKALTMSASIYAGNKLLARGSDEVAKTVENLLGMDHKSFFISVFARQKELNALTSHPKHMRKKLVLRMLEIENIDEAIRRLREDLRVAKSSIIGAQEELIAEDGTSRIGLFETELASMKKEEREFSTIETKMEKELDKVERVMKKLAVENDRLEKVRVKRDKNLRNTAALAATLKGLEEKKKDLEKELGRLETLEGKVRKNKVKMSKTKNELATVLGKQRKALEERDSLKGKANELVVIQKQAKEEIRELKKNIKVIADLGPESECPTCFRKLGKTHESLLSMFKKLVEGIEKQLEKDQEKNVGIKVKVSECEARTRALTKRENLLRNRLEDWKIEQSKVERIKSVREGLKNTVTRVKKITTEIGKIEKELVSLKVDDKTLNKSRKALEAVNNRIRSVEKETFNVKAERGKMEERIKSGEKELERLKKLRNQLDKKKKETELLSHLEGVMDGFKKHLISRIRPALASISSDLIASLTNGRYNEIELSEDYEISIRDGGAYYGIERFSGGEGDLANLCLRLAISEVIAEKHGTTGFNFIVLDEIFGSQDSSRRRILLSTLGGLSNRFKQIFLITHVEDVRELMGNVIQISENNDSSSSAEVL